jgi:hypothetical protein
VKRGAYCYDSGENKSNDIKTPNVLTELAASNLKVSKTTFHHCFRSQETSNDVYNSRDLTQCVDLNNFNETCDPCGVQRFLSIAICTYIWSRGSNRIIKI